MEWGDIDAALAKLRATLEPRIGLTMTRQVMGNLMHVREASGATPVGVLRAITQIENAFAGRAPMSAPWSLGDCRIIHECAVRKLWDVANRADWGRPLRGMLPAEAEGLAHHADALAPAFSGDGPEFRIAIAYHNVFTYQHHLVFGEPHDRNDPSPVLRLHAASAAQALPPGGRHHFAPISVVPNRGVIWALGPTASTNLSEAWSPSGFMFIPERGRSLRLDDLSDLRSFFLAWPIPIRPETLASLIWLLAAPFPWESRLEIDPALLARMVALEAECEAERWHGGTASALLGVRAATEEKELPELRLRFAPSGAELRYRPGKLEVF